MDTNKLPETVTATLYICVPPSFPDEVRALTADMSEHGYTILGTAEVTLDVPQPSENERIQALIESLMHRAGKVESQAKTELDYINNKIQELSQKAMEHDGGEG